MTALYSNLLYLLSAFTLFKFENITICHLELFMRVFKQALRLTIPLVILGKNIWKDGGSCFRGRFLPEFALLCHRQSRHSLLSLIKPTHDFCVSTR